jgi:hypothetical protein
MVPLAPLEVTARFALDGPWQPHGAARCRHAFVHAFRLLPPGSYRLAVVVRYRDGSKRLVPHGERLVTAPLERADMLLPTGGCGDAPRARGPQPRHVPILHGLARLVDADATQLEVRLRPARSALERPSELASEGSEDGGERASEVAARPSEDRRHVPSEDVSSSEEDQSAAGASSSLGVEIDQTMGVGTARKKKRPALRPCLSSQRQRRDP